MTTEKQLADALRVAENALKWSYEVADYPANGTSDDDKALAIVREALAAYDARPVATDEQVERVARAIYETASGPWEFASDYGQDIVRREARAAIAAMGAALPPQGDGLAELRALNEKATGGDWFPVAYDESHCIIDSDDDEWPVAQTVEHRNAAFIVACVNHVRAEIERTKGGW